MHTPPVVVGLDLSLSRAGWCVLPGDWVPGDWARVRVGVVVVAKRADVHRIERIARIRDRLVDAVSTELAGRTAEVFVEGYAFGAAQRAAHLGELGGVLRLAVFKHAWLNLRDDVAPASARATLGVPRLGPGEVKPWVLSRLGFAGAAHVFGTNPEKADEADAFVIANHGRSLLGLPFVTFKEAAPAASKGTRKRV